MEIGLDCSADSNFLMATKRPTPIVRDPHALLMRGIDALENAIKLEPKNFYAHLRMAEFFQRVGVPTRAKAELRIALDLAQGPEEKKIARDLLTAEERLDPRRAWRPDFSRLLGRTWRKK